MFYRHSSSDIILDPSIQLVTNLKDMLVKEIITNLKFSLKVRQRFATAAALIAKLSDDAHASSAEITHYVQQLETLLSLYCHAGSPRAKAHYTTVIKPAIQQAVEQVKKLKPFTSPQIRGREYTYYDNLAIDSTKWLMHIIMFQLLTIDPTLDFNPKRELRSDIFSQSKYAELKAIYQQLGAELTQILENAEDPNIDTLMTLCLKTHDTLNTNTATIFKRIYTFSCEMNRPSLSKIENDLKSISDFKANRAIDDNQRNIFPSVINDNGNEHYNFIKRAVDLIDQLDIGSMARKEQQTTEYTKAYLDNLLLSDSQTIPSIIHCMQLLRRMQQLAQQHAEKTVQSQIDDLLQDMNSEIKAGTLQDQGVALNAVDIKQALNNLIDSQLPFFKATGSSTKAKKIEVKHTELEQVIEGLSNNTATLCESIDRARFALWQHTSTFFTCGKPHSLTLCEQELNQLQQQAKTLNKSVVYE
jgi:hypothetical protein